MVVSLISFVFAGGVMAAMGVPMMRRKVPPNGLFGLRVPATMADEWVWYEANARSGRDFVVLGAVTAGLAILLPVVPGVSELAYNTALTFVLIGGVVMVAAVGWRRANRLLRLKAGAGRQPTVSAERTPPVCARWKGGTPDG
jgi:uncharacterized membrane protein